MLTGPDYTPQNPSTVVPSSKVALSPTLRIYSDDPRNNLKFLSTLTIPYEIIDIEEENFENKEDTYDGYEVQTLSNESTDPSTILNANATPPATVDYNFMAENSMDFGPQPPTNLFISANSFRIQDGSTGSDGSIRWIASLTFDDSFGATGYDYAISAVES
jgi:hypothetical protein